jgi:class 3 adenylate cyclase
VRTGSDRRLPVELVPRNTEAVRPPDTRYTKSGPAHIAYQVLGDGPIDLLFVSEWLGHVDAQWEQPRIAGFLEGLARFSRLILFDPRGMGASDPLTSLDAPTAEEWVDDALAALDATGSERAALLGAGTGSAIALLLAASHPQRISSLVVFNATARTAWAEDYPIGTPPEHLRRAEEYMRTSYPGLAALDIWAPDLVGDEAVSDWIVRFLRLSASPGTALAIQQMLFRLDVRAALSAITAPTLVLHRAEDRLIGTNMGRYVAEHIPDAVYRELPGIGHAFWAGDPMEIVDETQEFLTGVREHRPAERMLATILFTDIVGSTRRAAELGDKAWRALLNRHNEIVRRELERHRGREIVTTGDGFLATFDGPARAIACARAIRDEVRTAGIEIRAGIHSGEIELQGDDIAGIAVHIGARVMALAGGGEVLVSRTVVDLVAGSGIAFEARGVHPLKGVPGEWPVFAVAPS